MKLWIKTGLILSLVLAVLTAAALALVGRKAADALQEEQARDVRRVVHVTSGHEPGFRRHGS